MNENQTVIDQGCQCESCLADGKHASDCAVHNVSASSVGVCDCGTVKQL